MHEKRGVIKMRIIAIAFCVAALMFFLLPQESAVAADYSDEYLITDLCRQMETAYESLDPDAVVRLYHDLGPRGVGIIRKLFERSDSVSVELEFKEIKSSKTEAVVLMKHISLVHKWCNRKLEASPYQECRVRKSDGVWKFAAK